MGGYAASGGYYISCAANWIVAQPTTLTGSIGIFGTFPDVSNLVTDKLGVNVATVKTNELSDFGTPFRPFSAKEQDLLQQYINRGYDLFTRRCADGRGLAQDSIKVIGEGRVWTGVHALQLGLVDQLGSLDDAIAKAKELAGIEECTIADYPAQKTFLEQLMEQTTNKSTYADEQMRLILGEYYNDVKAIRNAMSQDNMQAAMPYIIKFNL
jgi:protease-4